MNVNIRQFKKLLLFSSFITLLWPGNIVNGQSTGWLRPAVTKSENSVGNQDNVFTSDNSRATWDGDNDWADYGNFSISIPVGSVIYGIEVRAEGSRSASNARNMNVLLSFDNGVNYTSPQLLPINVYTTATENYFTVGSNIDNWGYFWTATELNNTNFRVRLAATGVAGTLNIDHLQINIHYGPPSYPYTIIMPGTSTFTVPPCISSVTIQAWGGGASGGAKNNDARGGGGGGGYVTNTYSVTAGQTIAIVVGAGGIITNPTTQPGVNGGASSYNYNNSGDVVAGGGSITNPDNGGTGGAISGPSGLGSIKGGNGANRVNEKDGAGGGGGGSGPLATNASGQTGGTPGGGNGGNIASAGFNGTAPGGGGGGKGGQITSSTQSGKGANGQVIITWSSTNTWNGLVSTDWNTAGNWSCGVPTISTDVLIPTIPTGGIFPVLSAFTVLTYPEGYVKNIAFESGTTLIIENNALNVAGDLTLNGIIDLNGESQLIQGTNSGLSGTGTIEIDQQGEGNRYRYNYWSMPVYTANDGTNYTTIFASLRDGTIPGSPGAIAYTTGYDGSVSPLTLSSYWMFKLVDSNQGYTAWAPIGSSGKVYTGQGFSMKGPKNPVLPPATSEQNYVFEGKPNNGTIELDIVAGNYYLVGNPYPSAIDAEKFLDDNRPTSETSTITGAIYFWEHYGGNTHNLAGYQGGYATYSKGGGVMAVSGIVPGVSNLGSSVKEEPGQYIPVGQGFFVVGDKGGKIQFNNGQRAFVKESRGANNYAISVFMKSSTTKSKTTDTALSDLRPKFRIGFDAPKISHRQLLLTIDERATPALDWGFDAAIYEIFSDDMYWMLNNKKYVIQAFNEAGLNSEVPLGIQLSKTGLVTVKIDALENVDDDTTIYLKDKLTGESFNMMKKPVQLNLTAGKYTDRFVLLFKTQKLMAEDVVAEVLIPAATQRIIEGIHVFMNNAICELQIKNNSTEEITSVALVNALGQTVITWNSNFNVRTIFLPVSTATGIYLVQINTKTGKIVKKISVE